MAAGTPARGASPSPAPRPLVTTATRQGVAATPPLRLRTARQVLADGAGADDAAGDTAPLDAAFDAAAASPAVVVAEQGGEEEAGAVQEDHPSPAAASSAAGPVTRRQTLGTADTDGATTPGGTRAGGRRTPQTARSLPRWR